MRQAFIVEFSKLVRSRVGKIGATVLIAGVSLVCVAMYLGAHSGDPQVVAKLGSIDPTTWFGFFNMAIQVTGTGGLLGFGVVLAWQFAREFSDGTITGLFALPVSRMQIAFAKLAAFSLWATLVSILLVATLTLVAFGLQLSGDIGTGVFREFLLCLMSILVALPVALVATLGRSILAGVGAVIGLVVVAQIAVIMGAGGWYTLAAPALWAISEGEKASPLQLSLLFPVAGVFIVLTGWVWRTLQLDR